MTFDWTNPDGDNDHWKLELTGKDAGQIVWVDLPSGVKVQPIPVDKNVSKSANRTSSTQYQPTCYKLQMPRIIEQWLLFEYVGLEFTPLSKPFKTREQAEKAREKYPERLRRSIGVGVIRIKR